MKNKRAIAAFLFVFIIGLIMILFWYEEKQQTHNAEPASTIQNEDKMKEEEDPAEDVVEEVQEPVEDSDEVADFEKDTIKEAVTNVVEDTIDVFVEEDIHITAVGDSLTQGVGDEGKDGGYLGDLETEIRKMEEVNRVEISNYGVRGNRTEHLIKRLDKKQVVKSLKDSDIIIVTIGANDIMKVVKSNFTNLEMEPFTEAQAQYEGNLDTIFAKIRKHNPDAPIYLLGMYNPFFKWFAHIEELDKILENWNVSSQIVVKRYENVRYIPTDDLFRNKKEELLAEDNFHPNAKGYSLIAGRVYEEISPAIVKQQRNMLAGETERN
ncbi:SGNH/GDSL hydrolase family protein [Bacillus marinisedimentorum]|uniref:SGNH/GDSL hydrolase family protein n=1 Tax=Bacillus marinisedimentorum TaxID=1821260 RepID=UPI0007E07B17|nr:SGNH/GDSL hydrolase family protein [Bacillus marinisedimentorum]